MQPRCNSFALSSADNAYMADFFYEKHLYTKNNTIIVKVCLFIVKNSKKLHYLLIKYEFMFCYLFVIKIMIEKIEVLVYTI